MKIEVTGSNCADNIRYLRKKYRISRDALGRLIGIHGWELEIMIRGDRPLVFTSRQLRRLCAVFDVTVETLIHSDLAAADPRRQKNQDL